MLWPLICYIHIRYVRVFARIIRKILKGRLILQCYISSFKSKIFMWFLGFLNDALFFDVKQKKPIYFSPIIFQIIYFSFTRTALIFNFNILSKPFVIFAIRSWSWSFLILIRALFTSYSWTRKKNSWALMFNLYFYHNSNTFLISEDFVIFCAKSYNSSPNSCAHVSIL